MKTMYALRHPQSPHGARDRVFVVVCHADQWKSAVFVDGTAFVSTCPKSACDDMYNRLIEKNWVPIERQEIILVCFGMSGAEHDLPFWKSN